jgi:putative endopeptidase
VQQAPRAAAVLSCVSLAALACMATAACVAVREPDRDESAAFEATHLTADQVATTILAAMDKTADPCRNFYQYACGGWLDSTRLPPGVALRRRGVDAVEERNRIVLRDILEAAARVKDGPADTVRLGTYYAACMDQEVIDRIGIGPLQEILAAIDVVAEPTSLMRTLGWLHARGLVIVFTPEVRPDAARPATSIACLTQGGLGLRDRDDYLRTDDRSRTLRGAYRDHVARMLELAGERTADSVRLADLVVGLETQIAGFSTPTRPSPDPGSTGHRVERAVLQRLTPDLPWDPYFDALGYPALDALDDGSAGFFQGLADTVARTDPEVLRAYLKWQVVHLMADALPRRFGQENFEFYGRVLGGRPEIGPRWMRCVEAAERDAGGSLGRAFARRRLGGDSMASAAGLIRSVEQALGTTIGRLSWIDEPTRAAAIERLGAVTNAVGAPDAAPDDSGLAFRRTSHFGNVAAAARFELRRRLSHVGRQVAPVAWETPATSARARYDPILNAMVVPAGILQPPLFSPDFPPALDYGALGAAIARQLILGMDAAGIHAGATDRAHCVESLYDTFEAGPGVRVDGAATLDGNLADLGGVKTAHLAYRSPGATAGAAPSLVPGLTNDQLFFVGYAQSLCEATAPGTDPAAPGAESRVPARFRVRGALSSFPAFAEAFACAPETPMNPNDRCEVW